MRKFYLRIFALSICLFTIAHGLLAQPASGYLFSSSTGATLDPMTGSTNLVTASSDDGTSGVQSIGFDFNYEGTTYTQYSVNVNGLLKLGSTNITGQWSNSIVNGENVPKLMPSWDDHHTGTSAGGGKIHTVLIGTAPNRIRIIEWFVTVPRATTGAANTKFQCWLYESSNIIEFVYGASGGNTSSASYGIGGLTQANYLSVTTSSGTASFSSANNSNTAWPGDGTKYTFTPPAAPSLDLAFETIVLPATPCPNNNQQISAEITNAGTSTIDFATNNAVVTVNVTGASTQTLDVTLNNGTLAPGASMTVPLFPNADISAGGTHTFNGSLVMAGDGSAFNDNSPSAALNIVTSATLPVENDFTGFTGSNLATVFPGWREGVGATAPSGTTSAWTSTTGLGVSGNVTAKVNLWQASKREWIVSPRFPATANTVLQYSVAVTDFASVTNPAVMGSDDYMSVMVSTDCGVTWAELQTFNASNNLTEVLAPQSQSLAAYAGQDIMIAFFASEGTVDDSEDYDFHIDNIFVGESCMGTPTPGTVTGPSMVCSGVDFTLSVTGATDAAGITYQWQSSPDGTTWTDITGATSADLVVNQTAVTHYRRITFCGAQNDASNSVQVDLDVQMNCHCIPPTTDCTVGDEIVNVTLTTLNNASACGTNGYSSYFTALPIPDLQRTGSYPLSVTVSDGGTEHVGVWIDYNQNGQYEASEFTYLGSGFDETITANITIPLTATLGQTKMRVRVRWNTALTGSDACLGYTFGETEDYLVNITAEPACVTPADVTFTSHGNTSVTVNFNSPGSSFIVEYGLAGFTPGTGATAGTGGTVVTATASPVNITGLTANTAYDFYVRQDCGSGLISANSILAAFTTLCDPVNVPYVQDFNGVTTPGLPVCTSRENLNGATTWTTVSAPTGYSGSTLQYSWDGTTPGDDWFYTQGLNLTGGVTYRLVYRYGNNSTFYVESMKVAYGSTPNAGNMTTVLADYPSINDNTPHQDTIQFTPATTGVYYIGFHSYSDNDMFNLYLDDISVIREPLLDVSPVAIVTPPITCPVNMITVQATVKNMAMFPLDLSVNPVTVTATVTGAGTGSLTGTANTGTIAPGAEFNVFLSPTFDFAVGGDYNFAVTTTQAGDELSANDAYNTTISVNPVPLAPTFTPVAPAVCSSGGTTLLTASGALSPGSGTVGTGTGTSTTTTPYKGWWGSQKAQYLYTAAELTALGMTAGTEISSIAFDIQTFSGPFTFNGFTIAMKNTSSTSLGTTLETGTTTVLPATNFVLSGTAPFTVTHTLATPFVWDGTSNLLVETCFNNNNFGGSSSNSAAVLTTTVTGSTSYFSADGNATTCSAPGSATTSSARPNATFGFLTESDYTWSPAAGLFTDAAGTTAYAGGISNSVYVMPAATSTYTVTATSAAGCITTGDVTVTVNDPVTINTQPQSQVVCTGNTVTLTVDASNASGYQWMKNGVNIAGATDANYVIGNVAIGDTGTYSVTVFGLAPCGSVTSDNAVISFAATNSWVGTSNSDWNNPLNWCSGVPTETTNVEIPSGTPFAPVIQVNAPVNNITINNGATVEITASGRLKLHGSYTNNGTLDATAGTIEFMGAANQDVPAISAANIIMNGAGGITLNGDLNVLNSLTMTNGHITLGNSNLVMTGGSVGSAGSHIITNGTGTVTSNGIGAVSVVFPVGPAAGSYNPVTIANGQGRDYTVGVVSGLPGTPALANPARAVNRTWNITANTAPASPVNISLQYADGHVNASATPTANMQAGVSAGTTWTIVTPAAGMVPTGTSAGRIVHFQTATLGQTVVSNIGGITFPTATGNVDDAITSVVLMPNVVDNIAVLRVKSIRTTRVNWSVIDANGRTVMSFNRQVLAGQNDIQLILGSLAGGSYQLVGETEKGKIQTVRFVRQ